MHARSSVRKTQGCWGIVVKRFFDRLSFLSNHSNEIQTSAVSQLVFWVPRLTASRRRLGDAGPESVAFGLPLNDTTEKSQGMFPRSLRKTFAGFQDTMEKCS